MRPTPERLGDRTKMHQRAEAEAHASQIVLVASYRLYTIICEENVFEQDIDDENHRTMDLLSGLGFPAGKTSGLPDSVRDHQGIVAPKP